MNNMDRESDDLEACFVPVRVEKREMRMDDIDDISAADTDNSNVYQGYDI
mgnify:CR=1 FL=1